MATIEFYRVVTDREIGLILEKSLGPGFRVEVGDGRVKVEHGGSKGCLITLRSGAGRTSAALGGYMPSGGLRAVLVLPVPVVMSYVLFANVAPLVAGAAAAVTIYAVTSAMRAPSRGLVQMVEEILGGSAVSSNAPLGGQASVPMPSTPAPDYPRPQAAGALTDATTTASTLARFGDVSIAMTWLGRTQGIDDALRLLWQAMIDSKGQVTAKVAAALRAVNDARALLPTYGNVHQVVLYEMSGYLAQYEISIEAASGAFASALVELQSGTEAQSP